MTWYVIIPPEQPPEDGYAVVIRHEHGQQQFSGKLCGLINVCVVPRAQGGPRKYDAFMLFMPDSDPAIQIMKLRLIVAGNIILVSV